MNIIEVKAKCLNIEKARKIALENGFTLFGIELVHACTDQDMGRDQVNSTSLANIFLS